MDSSLKKLDMLKELVTELESDAFFPKYVQELFLSELRLAKIRSEQQKILDQYKNSSDLLINIGAGDQGKPDWVNLDVFSCLGVNCIYDCRKSLPFPNNSVKGIFCEHFLEHMDYEEEAPRFLSECYRVLKRNGVIRLIVPDIEMYLHAYCERGWEKISTIRGIDSEHTDLYYKSGHPYKFNYKTKAELINFVFRQKYQHKYGYDYETLENLLYESGFSQVQKQGFCRSLMPELCIDRDIRASESLYVEGIK